MSVSILSSLVLACGMGLSAFTSPPGTEPLTPATHTLTISLHDGGVLYIDGVAYGDTTLQLSNAHVATLAEEGNTLYTVTQPDGETFFKGDFTIAVQSVSTGTTKIKLQDGQAILAKATEK